MQGEEHYEGVKKLTKQGQQNTSVQPQTPSKPNDVSDPIITPHKRAEYVRPSKQKSSRKKKKRPELWKRNIRRNAGGRGLEYTSCKGETVKACFVKDVDYSKC